MDAVAVPAWSSSEWMGGTEGFVGGVGGAAGVGGGVSQAGRRGGAERHTNPKAGRTDYGAEPPTHTDQTAEGGGGSASADV